METERVDADPITTMFTIVAAVGSVACLGAAELIARTCLDTWSGFELGMPAVARAFLLGARGGGGLIGLAAGLTTLALLPIGTSRSWTWRNFLLAEVSVVFTCNALLVATLAAGALLFRYGHG